MSADVRQTLQRAAAQDSGGPDTEAILSRAGQLRRRRRLGAAGAAVLVSLAIITAVLAETLLERVQLAPGAGADALDGDVLDVPGADEEVAPAFLADGTPVFVVNLGEAGVHVLGARSPSSAYGAIGALVSWCRPSGWFEEASLGSRFTAGGYYADGPAPTGLVRFEVQRLDGGRVRVGDPAPPPPRSQTPPDAEARGSSCFNAPGDAMSPERDPLLAERWIEQRRAHYLDLAMDPDGGVAAPLPSAALAQMRDGDVLVYGVLEVAGSRARLCDPKAAQTGARAGSRRCAPGDPGFGLEVDAGEDFVHGWQGLIIAEVRDGRLAGATLTAAAVEYLERHGEPSGS